MSIKCAKNGMWKGGDDPDDEMDTTAVSNRVLCSGTNARRTRIERIL